MGAPIPGEIRPGTLAAINSNHARGKGEIVRLEAELAQKKLEQDTALKVSAQILHRRLEQHGLLAQLVSVDLIITLLRDGEVCIPISRGLPELDSDHPEMIGETLNPLNDLWGNNITTDLKAGPYFARYTIRIARPAEGGGEA